MTNFVAYQGMAGAFGHEACLTFLPDHQLLAKQSFADVIEAVSEGQASLGMLPYRNSIAGMVEEVEQLLMEAPVTIVERHWLAIRLHLFGRSGARIDDIRTIVSHPMALAQCNIRLSRLGKEIIPAANTAAAAKALADGIDDGGAVLASEAAGALYGLSILERDMQDRSDNQTEFVIIARPGSRP
jgi:prephenate dehydratase